MAIPDNPGNPPLGFRFMVTFLIGGLVPNPLDIMFQKVSGLGTTIETYAVEEGGQNFYTQLLPKKVTHENLTLERGMVVGSPLVLEFNVAMSTFKFLPSNVIVILMDNTKTPLASWLLMTAYPVKWSVSDLNAESNTAVIEHMELAYQRMQVLRI